MSVIKKFFEPVTNLWSLVVGLQITGRNFTRTQVTVHYPRQQVAAEDIAAYRGPIALVPHPRDATKSKCTACMICVAACPSSCITVVKAPVPKITAEEEQAFQEAEARGEEVERPSAPREPVRWINDFPCAACAACASKPAHRNASSFPTTSIPSAPAATPSSMTCWSPSPGP